MNKIRKTMMLGLKKVGEWRVQCCSTGGCKALNLQCLRLVIFLLGRVKAIADYVSSSLRFTAETFSRSAGLRRFQDTVPRVCGFAQERGAVLNSLRPQTSGAEACITAREPSDR